MIRTSFCGLISRPPSASLALPWPVNQAPKTSGLTPIRSAAAFLSSRKSVARPVMRRSRIGGWLIDVSTRPASSAATTNSATALRAASSLASTSGVIGFKGASTTFLGSAAAGAVAGAAAGAAAGAVAGAAAGAAALGASFFASWAERVRAELAVRIVKSRAREKRRTEFTPWFGIEHSDQESWAGGSILVRRNTFDPPSIADYDTDKPPRHATSFNQGASKFVSELGHLRGRMGLDGHRDSDPACIIFKLFDPYDVPVFVPKDHGLVVNGLTLDLAARISEKHHQRMMFRIMNHFDLCHAFRPLCCGSHPIKNEFLNDFGQKPDDKRHSSAL